MRLYLQISIQAYIFICLGINSNNFNFYLKFAVNRFVFSTYKQCPKGFSLYSFSYRTFAVHSLGVISQTLISIHRRIYIDSFIFFGEDLFNLFANGDCLSKLGAKTLHLSLKFITLTSLSNNWIILLEL